MIAAFVPQYMMGFILGMVLNTSDGLPVRRPCSKTFTAPPEGITDPLQTLPIYTDVFWQNRYRYL